MAVTKMKTKGLVGALVLALIAAAVVVKLVLFPSVRDAYFAMDSRKLQHVPAGLMVIRPTHFSKSQPNGIIYASSPNDGGNGPRIMGCNVPLRSVIAAAYRQNPARVVMPPDAPQGNFDFLMTVTSDPRQRLQAVIRQKLGYVAQKETRDTDVLALKIADANLPGLTVSGADEKEDVVSKDSKLYFTHMPLAAVAQGLQQFVKAPVVDKTDLTNFYDFTADWNFKVQRDIRNDTTARATADQIINALGLMLQPDTASLEMLVVKKKD
jgi:uncharacterized protein (TIGR03435 family)